MMILLKATIEKSLPVDIWQYRFYHGSYSCETSWFPPDIAWQVHVIWADMKEDDLKVKLLFSGVLNNPIVGHLRF